MGSFVPGDFLPAFSTDSSVNPDFAFSTVGGRQLILAFIGTAQSELGRNLAETLIAAADWLRERRILVFLVTADPRDRDSGPLANLPERYVAFWDFDRRIHRSYRMLMPPAGTHSNTVSLRVGVAVIRENLRLDSWVSASPINDFATRLRDAVAAMPPADPNWRPRQHAPVINIPNVIDREFCRTLIDYYETTGGIESGFMRDVDGQTRGLRDTKMKRRRDCAIQDPLLTRRLFTALRDRIVPEIRKAFAYRATRVERYLIGCYDESDRGFFKAHRDNTSKATAHRGFAVSLNLNSEEYDGGYLMFPEYGSALYKPDTGAAVVFSCSLLHEATPVNKGRRYVVLPFLYDEQGARIRAANLQYLHNDNEEPAEGREAVLAEPAAEPLAAAPA